MTETMDGELIMNLQTPCLHDHTLVSVPQIIVLVMYILKRWVKLEKPQVDDTKSNFTMFFSQIQKLNTFKNVVHIYTLYLLDLVSQILDM